MAAVANNPAFAKKAGVPQSVGKEFIKADKESGMKTTKKMAGGGITTAKMGKVTSGGKKPHGEHTVQAKGHTKGKQVVMKGGKPLGMKYGGKC